MSLKLSKNIDKEFAPGHSTADLCNAVQSNDLDTIMTLLEGKENLSSSSLDSVLWYAISRKFYTITLYLLNKAAYVNRDEPREIFYERKMVLLSWAIHCKNEFAIELLLRNIVKLNNQDEPGVGALYFSVKKGLLEITRLLLMYGANTTCKDDSGNSLLLIAAATDEPEFIDLLQKYKPDTSSTNNFGQNALHYAAQSPYDSSSVLKSLIKLGVPIDGVDSQGETPLHYALTLRKFKMARVLVDSGANVTLESRNKVDPLYISVMNKSSNLTTLILSKGANTNKILADGNTALHIACENDDCWLVSTLLKKFKADVDVRNSKEKVPFAKIQDKKSRTAIVLTRHIASLKAKHQHVSKENLEIITAVPKLRQLYKDICHKMPM